MKKTNNLFDDFPEIDSKNLESMKEDLESLHTSLKPTQSFKEQLLSRLEALSQYHKGQSFDIKKYTSGILAFTFLISCTWYFYANFFNENISKQAESIKQAQIFSDIGESHGVSEEMQIISDNVRVAGRMGGMLYMREYTEDERKRFGEKCESVEGFYIPGDEICILAMTDICDINSYINPSKNTCSSLFGSGSQEGEIFPYEGQ